MPEKEILKQAHKENKKVLSNPSVQGYRATYAIPNAMTDNGKLSGALPLPLCSPNSSGQTVFATAAS